MKVIAVTQARYGSSRLPGKILKKINGKTLLQLHAKRVSKSNLINKFLIATTNELQDDRVAELADNLNYSYYRGSESDVLDRYYQAVLSEKPDYVVRVTSDCPLIDPILIDSAINIILEKQVDYVSNTVSGTFPDGQDVEVFTFKSLEKAWKEATTISDREHVTPYIWNNSHLKGKSKFSAADFRIDDERYGQLRMTVDQVEDFELITKLINELGENKDWKTYANYILDNIEVRAINSKYERNEGYKKSLKEGKK